MPDGHCGYYDGDPDEYVGVVARAYEWAILVAVHAVVPSPTATRPAARRRLSFIRRRFFRRRRRICS
jgi:hypothetical protein